MEVTAGRCDSVRSMETASVGLPQDLPRRGRREDDDDTLEARYKVQEVLFLN